MSIRTMIRVLNAPAFAALQILLWALMPLLARAQQQPGEPGWPQPIDNNGRFGYAVLNQNEARIGDGTAYRWDGEGWYGDNHNRLWVKTEGSVDTSSGTVEEGEVQGLYSRAISPFFDLQAGIRHNFDSRSSRNWAALGVTGLAPLNWDIDAFAFVSSGGHLGGRLEGYYDLYLTQRLILQPQMELNAYSRPDRAAGVGTGLTDGEFALRLRYEIRRQFAPYVGLAYESKFGATADLARAAGGSSSELRFVAGVRASF